MPKEPSLWSQVSPGHWPWCEERGIERKRLFLLYLPAFLVD